jgi:hypothetical protein
VNQNTKSISRKAAKTPRRSLSPGLNPHMLPFFAPLRLSVARLIGHCAKYFFRYEKNLICNWVPGVQSDIM